MDNFIKKMRKTENSLSLGPQNDVSEPANCLSIENSVNTSFSEIRTSQLHDCQEILSSKIDLKRIEKYSKEKSNLMRIDELKIYEGYRTDDVCVIVKSVTAFRDTFKLELIDHTGIMTGHTDVSSICVNELLVLNGCGLWKLDVNHLNIVGENIIEKVPPEKDFNN